MLKPYKNLQQYYKSIYKIIIVSLIGQLLLLGALWYVLSGMPDDETEGSSSAAQTEIAELSESDRSESIEGSIAVPEEGDTAAAP